MKHGGGSIMLLGCFLAASPRRLAKVEGNMNEAAEGQVDSLCKKTMTFERFICKQDNDLKLTAKATHKWFKDNKVNVLEWLSQSPDLSPIEELWPDLKRDVMPDPCATGQSLSSFAKKNGVKLSRCASLLGLQPKVDSLNSDWLGVNTYAITYFMLHYIFLTNWPNFEKSVFPFTLKSFLCKFLSKELPEELRDRTVSRHRSEQGYKKCLPALKVPKSTVVFML